MKPKHHGHHPATIAAAFCLLTLLAAACEQEPDPISAPSIDQTSLASVPIIDPAAKAEMCPGRRMVGRVALHGSCPMVPTNVSIWSGGRLFSGPGSNEPELARYCLYTFNGQGSPTETQISKLPKLNGTPPDEWLDKDCMAIAPNAPYPATAAYETAQPELHADYLEQLGVPMVMPGGGAPVRVAILDSRPAVTALVDNDQLGHGLAMMSIIDNLTCDRMAGPCPITLRPFLALNMVSATQTDTINGGFFGYQSYLAQRIFEAVTNWQQNHPAANLIINLSLGWNPVYSEGNPTHAVSHAVLAVRETLKQARCAGALTFAAAGNDSGALHNVGPVEPAQWETQHVLCNGLPRRLLYSVGGVDGRDQPLHNARLGGRPTLAAPAFMVAPEHPTRLLGPYTGSSVGVAVASAAAALIWSQDPSLSPGNVVNEIMANSVKLNDHADYCAGSGCGNIHRISICEVASSAYGLPLGCITPTAEAGSNPTLTAGIEGAVIGLASRDYLGTCGNPYLPVDCSHLVTPLEPPGIAPPALPSWLLCSGEHLPAYGAVKAVAPQPVDDPCGLCTLFINPVDPLILLTVDEEFDGTAYPMTLNLLDADGEIVEALDLSRTTDINGNALSEGLSPGDAVKVEVAKLEGVSFEKASIQWLSDLANPRTTIDSAVLIDD